MINPILDSRYDTNIELACIELLYPDSGGELSEGVFLVFFKVFGYPRFLFDVNWTRNF